MPAAFGNLWNPTCHCDFFSFAFWGMWSSFLPGTQMPCFIILFPRGWAFEGTSCSWRLPGHRLRRVRAACPPAPCCGLVFPVPSTSQGRGLAPRRWQCGAEGCQAPRQHAGGRRQTASPAAAPPPHSPWHLAGGRVPEPSEWRLRGCAEPRFPPAGQRGWGKGGLMWAHTSVLSCQGPEQLLSSAYPGRSPGAARPWPCCPRLCRPWPHCPRPRCPRPCCP